VVQGQRGLLGQRLQKRKLDLGELPVVRRIGDGEDAEDPVAKGQRDRDDGAHGQRGVVMLDDAGIGEGVGDQFAPPRLRHAAHHALAHRKFLGLEHLLDEFGAGRQAALDRFGNGPVGREKALDRHPPHGLGRRLLKDARAQGARAKDRGVDDPLAQFLEGEALPERLGHEVHELDDALPVLGELLLLLLLALARPPGAQVRHQHRQRAEQDAEDKDGKHAQRFSTRFRRKTSTS